MLYGVLTAQTQSAGVFMVDTPNLYGAMLHVYRKATWLTPELYALLESDEGTVDVQMHFSAITRAEYDAWQRTHLKHGVLD